MDEIAFMKKIAGPNFRYMQFVPYPNVLLLDCAESIIALVPLI